MEWVERFFMVYGAFWFARHVTRLLLAYLDRVEGAHE